MRYHGDIDAGGTSSAGGPGKPGPVGPEQTLFGGRRFKLLEKLTRGEPAELYLAHDRRLRRRLTLKLLHANVNYDPLAAKLLEREAQLLARIDHPNVVGLLDIGRFGTERCLTLQPVGRHGLDEWLGEAQHDQAAVLGVLRQAGRGLAAAHAAGVVHGDLTPQRVRVDRRRRVRLVDFERACDLAPEPGAWERSVTPVDLDPTYMAPETRKHGLRDPLSDQYGFCLLAWEALTGRLPSANPWHDAGARSLRRDPVYRALARGLESDRSARWPDMDSLVQALAPSTSTGLRRGLYGAALVLLVVGGVVGGVLGTLALAGEGSGCALGEHE